MVDDYKIRCYEFLDILYKNLLCDNRRKCNLEPFLKKAVSRLEKELENNKLGLKKDTVTEDISFLKDCMEVYMDSFERYEYVRVFGTNEEVLEKKSFEYESVIS